jgi:DNA helicase-2/ATP-dependent DNA helicase PcrA
MAVAKAGFSAAAAATATAEDPRGNRGRRGPRASSGARVSLEHMFAAAWDSGLDDAQLAAVTHGESPLVIVAGAGTGKTRTLTARVASLLERGVPPERVLLLTFTRRAADDMLARAAALSGESSRARRLRGGTFHAVAHQMISAYAEPLGIQPGYSVLDPADAADVMDLLRDEHGLAGDGRQERGPRPSTLVDIYSRCVNTTRRVADVIATDFPWCAEDTELIGSLCKAYVSRKRERSQLDFDDLLLYWRAALVDERIGPQLAGLFDHVLVDEYQDVNALQVDIVRLLAPDGKGLTVVGDDAQAIYGFRGADACHLHDLARSLDSASVIRLECNFRSFQPILDVANLVRPPAEAAGERLTLTSARAGGRRPVLVRCYDAAGEARAVVDRILELQEQGTRLRDQAVLVRAAHHSDLVELELTARRVPYRKYGGLRFVEAAHVKDYVAAVRLLDNPSDDIAWFRLLRLHEGIGPGRARRLLDTLPPHRPEAVQDWATTVASAPPMARAPLGRTLAGLCDSRAITPGGTGQRAQRVLELVRPLVAARYHDSVARIGDLERLASAAAAAEDLGEWLAEITLDPPVSSGDYARPPHLDDDFVVVSTVHSAKGLEWLVVHLPHLVDGAFPSDMALRTPGGLEEERRLFYVATTRARDELRLYEPLRMPHHRRSRDDRHTLAPASRFLDEPVLGVLKVEEHGAGRRPVEANARCAGLADGAQVITVDLDPLW